MNGRIYDPTLGRFLQADPHIQAPMNSQNYNRYSYVLNNPLSYTDPSGYFFRSLFKGIKKYWRQIASIAVMFVPGINVIAAGFISGYIATGSLKGAIVGAFTAGMAGPVTSLGGFVTNGIVGGLASKAMGGKFGHGFWSAGIGAMAGGAINGIKTAVGRVVASALVGGTISKLTGGKFANGAFGAAFARALGEARMANQKPSYNEGSRGKLESEADLGVAPKEDVDEMLKEGLKTAKDMDEFTGKIAQEYKVDNRYGIVVDGHVKMFDTFDAANTYAGKHNGIWADAQHYKGRITLYKTAFYGKSLNHMSGTLQLTGMENVMFNLAHEGYHYYQYRYNKPITHSMSLKVYESTIVDAYRRLKNG